jgi:excinuclease ABC subunit A
MYINIEGAKVNNLKNVSTEIPRNKITVITGPSGSGKSSLAFHTLFTESKRRFINSFPTYLKFFGDRPAPVEVDSITPVLPAFALSQINPIVGARATVADTMGLTELLAGVFSRNSEPFCPTHKLKLDVKGIGEKLEVKLGDYAEKDVFHASIPRDIFIKYFSNRPFPTRSMKAIENGFSDFDEEDHYWEVFRFRGRDIEENIDKKFGEYLKESIPIYITPKNNPEATFKFQYTGVLECPKCSYSVPPRRTSIFNPYNALGACEECGGFGAKLEYDEDQLVDKELSVEEGGLKIFEFKRFEHFYDEIYWELKASKISTTKPIGSLPKKFWKLFYEGSGGFCGVNELLEWLESKKYKPSTRIFIRRIQKEVECTVCEGARVNKHSLNYKLHSKGAPYKELWRHSIEELVVEFEKYEKLKVFNSNDLSTKLMTKIKKQLELASAIGLNHLRLNRKTKTISTGEYQRLLLLKYFAFEGTDSLFIFDEPSLGLSDQEIKKIWKILEELKSQNNTIVIVDHNEVVVSKADHYIEMGPYAGGRGGEIIKTGTPPTLKTLKKDILNLAPAKKVKTFKSYIELKGAKIFSKNFNDVKLPLNEIIQIQGDSGVGKSALIVKVLANKLHKDIYGENLVHYDSSFKNFKTTDEIEDVIVVDSQLNRFTSRSTVGSYTDLIQIFRKHFSSLAVSKSMGLKDGHFSPNSNLGQCPKCEGKGVNIIEMQYLEDVTLVCEDCNGKKLKPIYANITDGKMTVHEALNMPISKSLNQMSLTPKFKRIMEYMRILNLDYLSLDRGLNTLSGGEKQRLFLLSKIVKKLTNSIIVIENISFGLSQKDLVRIFELFHNLKQLGNTIILIDKHEIVEKLSTYHFKVK